MLRLGANSAAGGFRTTIDIGFVIRVSGGIGIIEGGKVAGWVVDAEATWIS